jgi:hypothetical protein
MPQNGLTLGPPMQSHFKSKPEIYGKLCEILENHQWGCKAKCPHAIDAQLTSISKETPDLWGDIEQFLGTIDSLMPHALYSSKISELSILSGHVPVRDKSFHDDRALLPSQRKS